MASLNTNTIASPGTLPLVSAVSRQTKHMQTKHIDSLKSNQIEGNLRSNVNRSIYDPIYDQAAAEVIYAFRLNKAAETSKTYLKREARYYCKPINENIPDTEQCIKEDEHGNLVYWHKRANGKLKGVRLEKFNLSNSETIAKVLSIVKRSTNKKDKIAIQPISQIFNEKRISETINNTNRVQDAPKRICVFVYARKMSLAFEGVAMINSTAYLEELLRKLENPPLVNVLEIEARDIVKARLEEKQEEIRKGRS